MCPSNNDFLMLAQRLRRWHNIKTALFQRVVFAGIPAQDKGEGEGQRENVKNCKAQFSDGKSKQMKSVRRISHLPSRLSSRASRAYSHSRSRWCVLRLRNDE